MRITDIREKPVSLAAPMSNAAISFLQMTASAVAIDIDAGEKGTITGYGFSSVGRYAQSGLIAERFAPRLLAAGDMTGADGGLDPVRGWAAMMANEKPGGDGDRAGAVGVLDMALWDAAAKIEEIPLWRLLSERYNGDRAHDRVPVYATGGHYYPDGDLTGLQDEIKSYLDQGYERVKIKCGQGGLADDRARIEAVLPLLGDDGNRLAVDVNCMCSTSGDTQEMADAYAPYGLAWIEEPGHPHDFELLTALAGYYDGPIATGENLFSMSETYNLMRYGGPEWNSAPMKSRRGPILSWVDCRTALLWRVALQHCLMLLARVLRDIQSCGPFSIPFDGRLAADFGVIIPIGK